MKNEVRRIAAGVVMLNNKLLLTKRSKSRKFYPGVWDLPGGHCNENESYENAIKRELREELNIKATSLSPVKMYDKSPEFVLQVFFISQWEGTVENIQPDEHEKLAWFSYADIMSTDLASAEYYLLFDAIRILISLQ